MTFINKKRIGIMITCIMLALFTFSFQIANENQQIKELNLGETIETTSTPVSGKTVVLDARTWSSR